MHRPKRTFEDYEPDELRHLCEDPVFGLICRYCGHQSGPDRTLLKRELGVSDAFEFYNPELMEDPDNRPYIWDIPEGDCECH